MNRYKKELLKLQTMLRTNSRIHVFVAICAALTVLAIILLLQGRPEVEFTPLSPDRHFSQREIEQMETAFTDAQLTDYKIENAKILVCKTNRLEYLRILQESNVTNGLAGEKKAAFDKSSIFESRFLISERVKLALENELAEALRHFDAIETATVRFHETKSSGLHRRVTLSASVRVICHKDARLDAGSVQKIRLLVAGEKPGLLPDQITVTDLSNNGKIYPAGLSTSDGLVQQQELDKQQRHEQAWRDKILASLRFIENVKVVLNTSGDAEANSQTPASSVAVLIDVPTSYFYGLWKAKMRAANISTPISPNANELRTLRLQTENKIQEQIRTLFSTTSLEPNIYVSTFDDIERTKDVESTVYLSRPSIWWLPILFAVAAMVLVFLRRPVEKAVYRHFNRESELSRMPESVAYESNHQNTINDQLREQLSEVVKQDPQSAARVLQTWMKQAS